MPDSPKATSPLEEPPHQLSGPGKLAARKDGTDYSHLYIDNHLLKDFLGFLKHHGH